MFRFKENEKVHRVFFLINPIKKCSVVNYTNMLRQSTYFLQYLS